MRLYPHRYIMGSGKSDIPLSIKMCMIVAALGIILYGGIGLLSMFLGGEFLDYAELEKVLPVSREMARYHAMLGAEIGVGFTVTAIMFEFYKPLLPRAG